MKKKAQTVVRLFHEIDADRSGKLDIRELGVALDALAGPSARERALKKLADALQGRRQILLPGQKHQPQMVGVGPVEAAALNHQNALLNQQIQHQLLVIVDGIHRRVQAREQIHGAHGFDAADAGNVSEHAVGQLPLPVKAPAY